MKEAIRTRATDLGFDHCRFTSAAPPDRGATLQEWLAQGRHGEMAYLARNAHKRLDPQQVLPGAASLICLASSYHNPSPARPRPQASEGTPGEIARYAQHLDYHDRLAGPLAELCRFVDSLAGPVPVRSLWYVDTGPILERELAERAGIGFVGKHTNLVSRKLGNWFLLAEILTTLRLEPDAPEPNRCGTCSRCMMACPTAAITEPFKLDARRCISYLTIELKGAIPVELRPAVGNRIFGCDDCLAACPWNRFAREGRLMSGVRTQHASLPLESWLALDEEGFRRRFQGTPLHRTKRRGLLRNVCVALGNTAGPEALPTLQKATSDTEPLIAEHARWAMERIAGRASGTV